MIFSALMVKALLAGRKTQTRRVLKPQPAEWHAQVIDITKPFLCEEGRGWGQVGTDWRRNCLGDPEPEREVWVPLKGLHFVPGDRLWVKEACGRRPASFLGIEATNGAESAFYRADDEDVLDQRDFNLCPWWSGPTLSPIFMPRWASRLTLIVENVKVERLQDISEEDAIAEGVRRIGEGYPAASFPTSFASGPNFWTVDLPVPGIDFSVNSPTAAGCYRMLWEHIHGEGAWDANSWICAISFHAIPKNIDTLGDTP